MSSAPWKDVINGP